MISLGVDTSTAAGSVGLSEGDRILGEINLAAEGHHQHRLLRSVDLLLDLAGLEISRVGVLAVALGPGTFTGLRIGIATVKGLALARGVPVYGLSTLAGMAWSRRDRNLPVASLVDAGRREVYTALYAVGEHGPEVRIPERGGAVEEFLSVLPREPLLFCGDGVRECRERIRLARGSEDVLDLNPCFLGGTLAAWGAKQLLERTPWSLGELKPNYIRPPDAETGPRR